MAVTHALLRSCSLAGLQAGAPDPATPLCSASLAWFGLIWAGIYTHTHPNPRPPVSATRCWQLSPSATLDSTRQRRSK